LIIRPWDEAMISDGRNSNGGVDPKAKQAPLRKVVGLCRLNR